MTSWVDYAWVPGVVIVALMILFLAAYVKANRRKREIWALPISLVCAVGVTCYAWSVGGSPPGPAAFLGHGNATKVETPEGTRWESRYIEDSETSKQRAQDEVSGQLYEPGTSGSTHMNPLVCGFVFILTLVVSGAIAGVLLTQLKLK